MTASTPDHLYREIIEHAPDAVIFADRDGVIRLWNAGAETVFGYAAAEALGQTLDLIVPENLRSRHWDGYHRVMATGSTRYGAGDMLAVPAMRKDGTRISCEFSITPMHDASGVLTGIAAILRDVTARWQQERELRRELADLKAARAGAPPSAP